MNQLQLVGMRDYLGIHYGHSVFDEACDRQLGLELHVHPDRVITARVARSDVYDILLALDGGATELVPKLEVAMVYPAASASAVRPLIAWDNATRELALTPITTRGGRYHIKNKSLYALMRDKTVLFFTLLNGECARGVITAFSRYEIDVALKGGVPVTLMRHAVCDVRDKRGQSHLKSVQQHRRDWQKSPWYTDRPAPQIPETPLSSVKAESRPAPKGKNAKKKRRR